MVKLRRSQVVRETPNGSGGDLDSSQVSVPTQEVPAPPDAPSGMMRALREDFPSGGEDLGRCSLRSGALSWDYGRCDDDLRSGEGVGLNSESISMAISRAVEDARAISLRDAIRGDEDDPEWDWTQGGCHIFAVALKSVLGEDAEIVGVCQFESPVGTQGCDCWVNQHSMVRFRGELYDGKGCHTESYVKNEYKSSGAAWPDRQLVVSSLEDLRENFDETGEDFFFPEFDFCLEPLEAALVDAFALARHPGCPSGPS